MKPPWYTLRLLAIVLCIVFAALGSVAGQDQVSDPQPSPTDTGTPGLVVAANNLNVPTVPPPPDPWFTQGQGLQLQDASGGSPEQIEARRNEVATQVAIHLQTEAASQGVAPRILPNTQTAPLTTMPINVLANIGSMVSNTQTTVFSRVNIARAAFGYSDEYDKDRKQRNLHRQSFDVVYSDTHPTNGVTVNVFSNATFVAEDEAGVILMTGYFGFVAADTLIMIGERTDGTWYAFYDAYYSAYTVDGDVLIGNAFTEYTYDYDEDGQLLSLTDSDGGEYRVQVEDSGMMSIAGPDGYTVLADETGTFELYDAEGLLVVAGDLNDARDDEFAQFAASTSGSNNAALDNSDNANSSGDAGAGDDSGAGDSGGDAGGDDSSAGDSGGGGDG